MRNALAVLAMMLLSGLAFAQSSGNFAARVATMQCVLNQTTGGISEGLTGTVLSTTIKTPNSGQTALVIRPSLVTGLFTRTKVDSADADATAVAGVRVRVLIDGKIVAPGTPVGGTPGAGGVAADAGYIWYDKRFQRLSTNIFNLLGTDCDPAADGDQPCFIDLILSTLSAHSFDYVVGDVGVGDHTLTVEWELEPTSSNANEAACVGPGVVTVQQVKTFSTGGGIFITSNN